MHSASSQLIANTLFDNMTFNAVILCRANSEALLVRNGCQLELPIVIIPKWRRVAQEVTGFISQMWGLKTIYLFQPEAQSSDSNDTDHFVVLEARNSSWLPPSGFNWVSRVELRNGRHSIKDARTLHEILATVDAHNDDSLDGPFARAGWFDALVAWAQKQIDPYRLRLTGDFCQLNGSPTFSLIRLQTSGPSIWFKAVGEPNRHEFLITIALTRYFPLYLPALIATEPAWNGWLSFEVDGAMMDENSDISTWEKAAETLANLQIESIERTPDLLAASCRDLRVSTLLDQIEPFFALAAELMTKQSKVPPPVLSRHEIRALSIQIRQACFRLQELGIPDTLGHLDLNLGNIIVAPERCVFLDWAEACIGHPLFAFEYLRANLARVHPGNEAGRSTVTYSYLRSWCSLIPAETLSQALELTPLLAVYAYAIGIGTWRDSKRLENPQLAGFVRALTRRMQREARLMRNGGAHA